MPGKHWSLLPILHNEIVKPHINPNLDEPSILYYFYKTYILPNGRKRFDGKPYKLEDFPDLPDTKWFI